MRLHSPIILVFLIIVYTSVMDSATQQAIIDVHLHAGPNNWTGPGAPSDPENDNHLRDVLSQMDRHNVKLAVISGPMAFVEYWKKNAPDRFIASLMFPCEGGRAPLGGRQCFSSNSVLPEIDWVRERASNKYFGAMGEITAQYAGLSPSDTSLEPYYAIAEEFALPVGVHTGLSYPGTPYQCCPKFRAALGTPMLLEDMLVRHPKLAVYAMHAGYPYVEDTLAMMVLYPQLHVDISAINYLMPKDLFHAYLKKLIDHGFAKRILFGSDDFPMTESINSIESAEFLTEEQKSDILCANAARFFRLEVDSVCKAK
ncbi:amidohydrolase family protein [bacterium]|nr:amidohydrolase family protein [bacterium]